jgi:hypothetical protein
MVLASMGGFRASAVGLVILHPKRVAARVWALAQSRRWLLTAVTVTLAAIGLIRMHSPPAHLGVDHPDQADLKFDDVTTFPVTPKTAALRFRPPLPGEAQTVAASGTVSALAEDPTSTSSQVTRRLDAVRSWQSRGATLTGGIESFSAAAAARRQTATRERPGTTSRQ